MKDRIPTYPNRIALTPVNGQDNVYDLARADVPIEEGTKLNKNSLLNDNAAEAIFESPTGNETPSDALLALVPQVGDIKATVKNSLGSKWLLCDGATVSGATYPDLVPLLPSASVAWTPKNTIYGGTSQSSYNNVAVNDDGTMWVNVVYDSADSVYKVYTASSADAEWVATGETITNQYNSSYKDITYGNGYFAFATGTYVYYTQDPTSTWNYKRLTTSSIYITDINYVNGYFVATYGSGRVEYSADPSSSWTVISNTPTLSAGNIIYGGGYYVTRKKTSPNSILYGSDITQGLSSFTSVTVASDTSGLGSPSRGLMYAGGYYMLVNSVDGLYYASTPGGPWTLNAAVKGDIIAYDGTNIIVGDYANSSATLYYATSPSEASWTSVNLGEYRVRYLQYAGGKYLANGSYYSTSIGGAGNGILPSISAPDYNVYIRALP